MLAVGAAGGGKHQAAVRHLLGITPAGRVIQQGVLAPHERLCELAERALLRMMQGDAASVVSCVLAEHLDLPAALAGRAAAAARTAWWCGVKCH